MSDVINVTVEEVQPINVQIIHSVTLPGGGSGLTDDELAAINGAAAPSGANVFATADDLPDVDASLLTITAMEWDVGALEAVTTALTMDADLFGEFTATLPLTGTTTTISITNLPTEKNRWPVLHLIVGATFDEPTWTGIDATGVTLTADTTHNIGFQPVWATSGWKVVAVLMHSEADA